MSGMFDFILIFIRNSWNSIMSIFGFSLNTHSLPPQNSLQVFIRTNLGEQVCVTLDPSWTVQKVKSNLAAKLKSSEELKIIFAGKELPDDLLIGQCDLGNRSMLHAVRVEANTNSSFKEDKAKHKEDITDVSKKGCEVLPRIAEENIHAVINEVKLSPIESGSATPPKQEEPLKNKKSIPRLLCDASTVMTIQLSEEELQELNKLKSLDDGREKPHFYVYCIHPCASVRVGKLRVRCSECKGGALTLHRDPASWHDVLQTKQITATCESPNCSGTYAEFFFKCREHETMGEDDTAVVLYLIRANLPGVPCLACTDVSSPIIVFQCSSAHVMCLDCFVTYCVSRLNERQFVCDKNLGYTLPCPARCPDSLIEEIHHFKLMGTQHYERYQRFGAEEALLAAGGVLCPRPGCGQGILPDEDCRRVKCVGGCEYVFCKDCLQGYHIGECITDGHYFGSTSGIGSGFAINPDRAALSSWDEASSLTIRVITKPCPKCRTPTERDGGCMHMVCTRASCQFHWCWVCQTEWTRECMAAHWFG